jgi:PleD family two-component response regulator
MEPSDLKPNLKKPDPSPEANHAEHETIKILIVDDDENILNISARILKGTGCRILTATTGKECMASVRANRPDLILLDMVLPDISGMEICRELKADPLFKKTFILFFSGHETDSIAQAKGLNVGADGYIVKPITNSELLARVNAFIRIIRAERERDRLIGELQQALSRIKQLSGLLPICSHCSKIRDENDVWNRLETYIEAHSEAGFSHSICPECAGKHFPGVNIYD